MKNTYKRPLIIITFGILLYTAAQNIDVVWRSLVTVYLCVEPIIGGLVIAFLLNVPVSFFEEKVFGRLRKYRGGAMACRTLSLILALLLTLGAITLVFAIIIPELVGACYIAVERLPATANSFLEWVDAMCLRFAIPEESLPNIRVDWANVTGTIMEFLRTRTSTIFNAATTVTSSVFGGMFSFVMMAVIAIYTSVQKERIGRFLRRVVHACLPEHVAKRVLSVSGLTFSTFYNFITGQLIEAVILGVLCFLGMLLFRFPYASVISVVIGVGALIPILGAWIGAIVGGLLILTIDPWQAFWFIVFLLTLQQIEGNLIYPRVVGRSIGVPGLLVMCAVAVGGNIGGVMGTLLSVPISAVLFSLLCEYVAFRNARPMAHDAEH